METIESVSTGRARRSFARGAAVLLALVLIVAGCADDDAEETDGTGGGGGISGGETQVEEDEALELLGPEDVASGDPVRVGFITDGSTAAVDLGYEQTVMDATAEYINNHTGGIAGRPIEIVPCVQGADDARSEDCGNQMVEEQVVAVLAASVGSTAFWTPVHDAGIPVMIASTADFALFLDEASTFILSNGSVGLTGVPIQAAQDIDEDKVTVVVINIPNATISYDTPTSAPAAFEEAGIELEVVKIDAGSPTMDAQMQQIASGDHGVVHVIGNDTFCISAFNGLQAAGFEGQVTTVAQCISDETLAGVDGEFLEGIRMHSTSPIGSDDESVLLFNAVMETYGEDEVPSGIGPITAYITLSGFDVALEGLTGEVTPATVIAAIKGMPDSILPGTGGLHFRCNGEAGAVAAICTGGGLITTLDAEGQPTDYQQVSNEPIPDAS